MGGGGLHRCADHRPGTDDRVDVLLDRLGRLGVGGAFSLFACVSASHFVFTYALLPETRGKTLEEIEALFGRDVRDGVEAMTKREGEDYSADYLPRLQRNPGAVLVKIADSSHNLGKAHLLAANDPVRAGQLETKYMRVLSTLGVETSVPERLVFDGGAWRPLAG